MADGMLYAKGPKAQGLAPEVREELATFFWRDPVLALRELLPHWFSKKMPWVHRGIMALYFERADFLLNFGTEHWQGETAEWTVADLRKIEKHFVFKGVRLFEIAWDGDVPTKIDLVVSDKMCVVLPRGFSKTTLFKALILLDILYQTEKVMLYVSEAGPHAAAQVNDIRMEIQFNERLVELYGKLAPDRQDPQKWTDEEFETLSGIHLISRGRGGQVRGLNRAATRPGKIVFDDLEDEESVSTDDQRKKVRKWFRGALERAGKLVGRTKIFGLGTILDFDALIPNLKRVRDWLIIEFGAIDLDGEALWPEAMDLEKIEQTKLSYAETDDLPVFYREIMSQSIPDEDKKFRLDTLVRKGRDPSEMVVRAIAIDPAISKKRGSSLCAFAVVGMDPNGRIHVFEAWGKGGMSPREQVDKYFELAIKYDCTRHGVEAIAYQQALIHLLQEEMFRKGKIFGKKAYFEVVPIQHNTDEAKHKRILGTLQPRYKSGYITHDKTLVELEVALRDWPNCKMDLPDAVAMALTLCDEYAGLAAGDEVDEDSKPGGEDDIGDLWMVAP